MASLRPLFVWALLGYAAAEIFFTFARWVEPMRDGNFVNRAVSADFTTLVTVGFPILAVLIAAHLQPVLGMARFVAAVALAEYAAIIGLGAMAFIIGLPNLTDFDGASSVLSYVVLSMAGLAFAALAAFGVARSFVATGGTLPIRLGG